MAKGRPDWGKRTRQLVRLTKAVQGDNLSGWDFSLGKNCQKPIFAPAGKVSAHPCGLFGKVQLDWGVDVRMAVRQQARQAWFDGGVVILEGELR